MVNVAAVDGFHDMGLLDSMAQAVCNYTLICCKDILFISNQSTDYLLFNILNISDSCVFDCQIQITPMEWNK